jgi:hypothetical protein
MVFSLQNMGICVWLSAWSWPPAATVVHGIPQASLEFGSDNLCHQKPDLTTYQWSSLAFSLIFIALNFQAYKFTFYDLKVNTMQTGIDFV